MSTTTSTTTLLFQIIRLAKTTWDPCNAAALGHNVQQLKLLVDRLGARDFDLAPSLLAGAPATAADLGTAVAPPKRPAPCTYVSLLDHPNVTISVFILAAGTQMPLHDHPCMHGLLKAISGRLSVQGYTAVDPSGQPTVVPPHHIPPLIPVRREAPVELVADSPAVLLTPSLGNYHRIGTVGGAAAFFDILSPPYQAAIPEFGARPCSYYAEMRAADQFYLVPTQTPDSFWCTEVPYRRLEVEEAEEPGET